MITNEMDENYLEIINPILDNDNFNQLKDIKHHNSNRLDHSIKVSYYSYKIAKFLKLDYIDVARAGLLHDFYLGQVKEQENLKDKVLLFTTQHPNEALENASKYFTLTEKECDIIKSHMFPVDVKVPKYAESWIVSLVDKWISTIEFKNKFKVQLSYSFNLLLIFMINFIR